MGKMDISVYMKGDYEDIYGFGRRENKANSKPNKANLSSPPDFLGVERLFEKTKPICAGTK